MIAAYPYSSRLASTTAGTGMPAGTLTPGVVAWPGGQMPGGPFPGQRPPQAPQGTGGWPGGYISPTAGNFQQQRPQAGGTLASPVAGVSPPQGTITPGKVNLDLLRKLGILPPEATQQQPPMPAFLEGLGLGNFYTPHGMGDAQNVAGSTIGGAIGSGYSPPVRQPVVRRMG